MEGVPTGDIQAKYQKLASEYSKLRIHVKVLKKGVLDEQAKSNEFREALKEKEKSLRKGELEIDSLSFRNQQLTRRVSVLQDELEALQLKLTKKSKGKDEKQPASASTSVSSPLDPGLLQEELQKKIMENAQYASQLSDKTFEASQLKASLEDYQRHMSEAESKYKCEIAKLRNKNQELQYSLEELQKEKGGTPSKITSQAASCNGDFISEGGSLMGSEDALSSVGDLNVNEQISIKAHTLEQENQKLRMEYELLQMECESLRQEAGRLSAKRQHDSGDFNHYSDTNLSGDNRLTGLLGSLEVPFLLSQEIQTREDRMKTYFRNKISELKSEREEIKSKTEHYVKECENLRSRFEELEVERESDQRALEAKHNTISRLEDELHSTSHNYEQQMSVLSEHVASLSEKLVKQHDQLQTLTHQLNSRRK